MTLTLAIAIADMHNPLAQHNYGPESLHFSCSQVFIVFATYLQRVICMGFHAPFHRLSVRSNYAQF